MFLCITNHPGFAGTKEFPRIWDFPWSGWMPHPFLSLLSWPTVPYPWTLLSKKNTWLFSSIAHVPLLFGASCSVPVPSTTQVPLCKSAACLRHQHSVSRCLPCPLGSELLEDKGLCCLHVSTAVPKPSHQVWGIGDCSIVFKQVGRDMMQDDI